MPPTSSPPAGCGPSGTSAGSRSRSVRSGEQSWSARCRWSTGSRGRRRCSRCATPSSSGSREPPTTSCSTATRGSGSRWPGSRSDAPGAAGHRDGARQLSIVVVPISAGVDAHAFAEELTAALGPGARPVGSDGVDDELGRAGIAQIDDDDVGALRLAYHLEGLEERNHHLVYEIDEGWTAWSRRALRWADHILLVGDAERDPQPEPLEEELWRLVADHHHPKVSLALLHPAGHAAAHRHGPLARAPRARIAPPPAARRPDPHGSPRPPAGRDGHVAGVRRRRRPGLRPARRARGARGAAGARRHGRGHEHRVDHGHRPGIGWTAAESRERSVAAPSGSSSTTRSPAPRSSGASASPRSSRP